MFLRQLQVSILHENFVFKLEDARTTLWSIKFSIKASSARRSGKAVPRSVNAHAINRSLYTDEAVISFSLRAHRRLGRILRRHASVRRQTKCN